MADVHEYKQLLDRLKSESPYKQTTIVNSKLIALLESSPFIDMVNHPLLTDEVYTPEDIKDRVLQNWNEMSRMKKLWFNVKGASLFGLYLFVQLCLIPVYAVFAIIGGALAVTGGCFVILLFALMLDFILTMLGYGTILDDETRKSILELIGQ